VSAKDHRRWLEWLADDRARDPQTGLWWSWCNPDHPGYPYEEATAWVIRLAAQGADDRHALALRQAADQGLETLLSRIERRGGLGRGGRLYAFDTAVGLAALQAVGGHDKACATLISTLCEFCDRRVAVEGGPTLGLERATSRWSNTWGAHLLWLNEPLLAAGKVDRAATLTAELLDRCLRDDGLLRIHGASDAVYAHAAAYAAQGLMACGEIEIAARLADTLLRAQRRDGLVPAWIDRAESPGRSDVTAQVLWIWRRCGDRHLAEYGDRARRALTAMTAPCGGLRYEFGCDDVVTWATVFAVSLVDDTVPMAYAAGSGEARFNEVR
jgi:hypothetical protein